MNPWMLLLLLLPAPVKVEHGRFDITQEGRKIGTDEFTISRNNSNYVLESKTTIGTVVTSSRMELSDKLIPVSYEVSSAEGKIRVNVSSPISELQTIVRGDTSSADFRFPENGAILDNNFFDHYLMLLYRAQAGQTDFPVFVPQDRRVGTATVHKSGQRSYDLEVGEVKMQASVDNDGSLIRLVVPSAKVVVER
jgi:hypothetical protein